MLSFNPMGKKFKIHNFFCLGFLQGSCYS